MRDPSIHVKRSDLKWILKEFFEDLDDVDSEEINFFNTTKVTRKQRNGSGANVKRNQVDDFSEYKKMFKQVQRELASGLRKFIPFKNYNIVLHHYYLLKNQLT